jgi:hypothetical protein
LLLLVSAALLRLLGAVAGLRPGDHRRHPAPHVAACKRAGLFACMAAAARRRAAAVRNRRAPTRATCCVL